MEHILGILALLFGFVIVFGLALLERRVAHVLLLAFLLRASLAVFHTYIAPLPDSQADALTFERMGWEWASRGWSSVIENWTTGAFLYTWLISVLYALTARSPLMIQAINVLLGTLVVYLTYRIAAQVSGHRAGCRAAWFAALFPTLNLYSALTMREAFIVFFFLLGVLYALRWDQDDRATTFCFSALFLALSGAFHTGMLPMLGVLGLIAIIRWASLLPAAHSRRFVRVTTAVMLLALLGVGIIVSGWGLEKVGLIQRGLGEHQATAARDRAAYLSTLVVRQPLDLLWHTPIRVVYFLFSPFPWWVRQPVDVLGVMDASLYLWLTAHIMRRRGRGLSWNRRVRLLVLFLAAGIAVFALATSNYGTAVRHRAKFAPLFIAVAMAVKHDSGALTRP